MKKRNPVYGFYYINKLESGRRKKTRKPLDRKGGNKYLKSYSVSFTKRKKSYFMLKNLKNALDNILGV